MANLTIEDVPDELLDRLRRNADRHGRSSNAEVVLRLELIAARPQDDPRGFLDRLDEFQRRTNAPPLTDEISEQAITEGRL